MHPFTESLSVPAVLPVYSTFLNEVRPNQRRADINQVVCSIYRIPPSCTVRDSTPHQQMVLDQASSPHRTVPYRTSSRTHCTYLP